MSAGEHKSRSRALLIGLIVGSLVAAVALFPAILVAMMSLIAADAGNRYPVFVFLILAWSLPVVTVLGPVLGWVAFGIRRERMSWALLLSPAVWAVATFALLYVIPG